MTRRYGQGPNYVSAGFFLGLCLVLPLLAIVRVYG